MTEPQVGVFIGSPTGEMNAERIALARALSAFNGHFQLVENADPSTIYMGVLGGQYDDQLIQELERARAAGKKSLLFIKQTAEREPTLSDYLERLEDLKPEIFIDSTDLTTLAIRQMEKIQMDLFPGWRNPPLPPRDRFFAGRTGEIDSLSSLLMEDQPIVISGAGGIGKSSLALETAHRLRARFPGGIFWLDGFGVEGNTLEQAFRKLAMAHPVGRVISAEPRALTPGEVQSWLAEAPGRGLVIVDQVQDIDTLYEFRAVLPFSFALLVTAPQPIEGTTWKNIQLSRLSMDDGIGLLRVVLHIPTNLTPEMLSPVESVVALLDGHALSLRFASSWLKRMGGWRAALLFVKRFNEIDNVLHNLMVPHPRQEHAERTFSLIYKTLTTPQKALLRAAGVFAPGSISRKALLGMTDEPESSRLLENDLAGLLQHDEITGGYLLQPLIRGYVLALLYAMGESYVIHSRHLNYYLSQAAQHLRDQNPASDSEISQYRLAFVWAREYATERLIPFVMSAGQWLSVQHQYDELRHWLETTLKAVPNDEESLEHASLLRGLGDLSVRVEHNAAARQYYDRALLLYYQTRSFSGQANTLKALGDLSARENQYDIAQEYYDRTLQLYAQIDFQLGHANTLKALGDLSVQSDDLKAARDYYSRTLSLYEQIDFQLGEAHTLKSLGDLSIRGKDFVGAQEYYHQALPIYHEIGFHTQEALTLIALGDLHVQLNAIPLGQDAYEEALRIYRNLGDKTAQASTLKMLGKLFQRQEHDEAAAQLFEEALELYSEVNAAGEEALLCEILGLLYQKHRQYPEAVRLLIEALNIFTSLNIPRHIEEMRDHLRETARKIGEAAFPEVWAQASNDAPLPDWLKRLPQIAIPQELIYAVRDFMIADNWAAAQRVVEKHRALMMTDAADEVFARMLRQYAGQPGPTRQIDKYRGLLQRCRQVGIEVAFQEIQAPATSSDANRAARLYQSLDAYAEALERLKDIPLVYAGIQLSRASTLREIAALPEQDRVGCLMQALEAYDPALERQRMSAPMDFAQTQLLRAETLRELSEYPGQERAQHLYDMLAAYDEALVHQKTLPTEYARTQLNRANTLHLIGKLPGEKTVERMEAALTAYNDALERQHGNTVEYARTQSQRAGLLYEMAGLPGQDFNVRMWEALTSYDEALEYLREDDPLQYARTQSSRIALLRDMAGLPGEDRTARLYQALAASNEALRYLDNEPVEYARTQLIRAHLLREIAGLNGEHRLARMREALVPLNEALVRLRHLPLDYINAQTSRAALLRELAGFSGENRLNRLRQSMEAAGESLKLLENLENPVQLRNARRMMVSARQEVIQTEGQPTFDRWWEQIMGAMEQPDWLLK